MKLLIENFNDKWRADVKKYSEALYVDLPMTDPIFKEVRAEFGTQAYSHFIDEIFPEEAEAQLPKFNKTSDEKNYKMFIPGIGFFKLVYSRDIDSNTAIMSKL